MKENRELEPYEIILILAFIAILIFAIIKPSPAHALSPTQEIGEVTSSSETKAMSLVNSLSSSSSLTPSTTQIFKDKIAHARNNPDILSSTIIDMLETNKEFSACISLYNNEQYDKASISFKDFLSNYKQEYVASPFYFSYCYYFLGKIEIKKFHYLIAAEYFEVVLKSLQDYNVDLADSALNLGLCYAKLSAHGSSLPLQDRINLTIAAIKCLAIITDDTGTLGTIPERIKYNANQNLEDMENNAIPDPLDDLASRMNELTKNLRNEKTGQTTQSEQNSIVEELDNLILEAKKMEKKDKDEDESKSWERKHGQEIDKNPGDPDNQNLNPNLSDTERKRKNLELLRREADRHSVLQMLERKEGFNYNEMVKQYFKAIADAENKIKEKRKLRSGSNDAAKPLTKK